MNDFDKDTLARPKSPALQLNKRSLLALLSQLVDI